MAAFEERSVGTGVGRSVTFKGTIVSSEDLTIDGRVEGSIEVRDHSLAVGPDADIHADISAATITIHGKVSGQIRASEKIEIGASGRVEGDLTSPRLVMHDGALVCGRVDTVKSQSAAAHQMPAPALALA
jgi:cytoskeletal protein CcmA (bactofilin family)